jgi:hypothetical protein
MTSRTLRNRRKVSLNPLDVARTNSAPPNTNPSPTIDSASAAFAFAPPNIIQPNNQQSALQGPSLEEQLAAARQELDQYRLQNLAREVEMRLRAENEARFRDLESRLNTPSTPSVTSPTTNTAREKILLKLDLDSVKKFDSNASASTMRLFFTSLNSLFEDADAVDDDKFCLRVLKSLLDDSASNALELELDRLRRENIPPTYNHAKLFLFDKYHANFTRNMEDAFLTIRQGSDSLLEYAKRFDDILLQIPQRSEDAKISKFINGLSFPLRTEVLGQRRFIKTLQDAIDSAQDKETASRRSAPRDRTFNTTQKKHKGLHDSYRPHKHQETTAYHTFVDDDGLTCCLSDDDVAGDSEVEYAYATMHTSNPNRIKTSAWECPYCDERQRHFKKDCAIWTAETKHVSQNIAAKLIAEKRARTLAQQAANKDTFQHYSSSASQSLSPFPKDPLATHYKDLKINPAIDLVADSAATSHMHHDLTVFTNPARHVNKIRTSNNSCMYSTHKGTLRIPNNTISNHRNHARSLELHNALYVPDLLHPLFSIPAIAEQGFSTHIWPDGFLTCDRLPYANSTFRTNAELVGKRNGNLFYIPASGDNVTTNNLLHTKAMTAMELSKNITATADDVTFNPVFHEHYPPPTLSAKELSANVMHLRLGHLGKTNTRKMATLNYDMKLPTDTHSGLCVGCCRGKQPRTPFPLKSQSSYNVGEHVAIDFKVINSPKSLGGFTYALSFTDHHSNYVVTYLTKGRTKEIVLLYLRRYLAFAHSVTGNKLKFIRWDNGLEFRSSLIKRFTSHFGITNHYTCSDSSVQNGKAERTNRTLADRTRAMLFHAKLPLNLWGELWYTAAYLHNKSPSSSQDPRSIPEAIFFNYATNRPVKISHLRAIGCVASFKDTSLRTGRIAPKATIGIMVGYAHDQKGYRIWDPVKNKIFTSRDIIWSEHQGYDDPAFAFNDDFLSLSDSSPFVTTHEACYLTIDNDPMDPLPTDPKSFTEACKSQLADEWWKSMREEYDALMENHTWDIVRRPIDTPVISSKWVYKTKLDTLGKVERLKSRFTARGFTQRHGINYWDTYAPVLTNAGPRIVTAIAAAYNLPIYQYDISSAFLYGEIDTEIFIEQPKGFTSPQHPPSEWVCRLRKALYGLKQAGRIWNDTFIDWALKAGFKQSVYEPCILIKRTTSKTGKRDFIIIGLHVDDIQLAATNTTLIENMETSLRTHFKLKNLGPAHKLLGYKVTRNTNGSYVLDQAHTIKDLISKFLPSNLHAVRSPTCSRKPAPGDHDPCNKHDFQSLVGSLMFLANSTRPDICHAVNQAARHMQQPSIGHWKDALRILQYLKGTTLKGLIFNPPSRFDKDTRSTKENLPIMAYSDADWGGKDGSSSTTGIYIELAGCPIIWKSSKQKCISLSTLEAEYVAASLASREIMWLRNLLSDLGFTQQHSTNLLCIPIILPFLWTTEQLLINRLPSTLTIKAPFSLQITPPCPRNQSTS